MSEEDKDLDQITTCLIAFTKSLFLILSEPSAPVASFTRFETT